MARGELRQILKSDETRNKRSWEGKHFGKGKPNISAMTELAPKSTTNSARGPIAEIDAIPRHIALELGIRSDVAAILAETDMTEDLKKIDAPTLIFHGDDNQIVPIADSAILSAKRWIMLS